jgi:1,4-dihydroxy-2-naphthoate octaprenyltransferase
MSDDHIYKNIKAWLGLSRLPFHSVGILPFILGTLLAWKFQNTFDLLIFILGATAVALIMLSTYQAGEYFDYQEDTISKSIFNSRFSGGSGVIQAGLLSRDVAFWTSIISFILAAMIGIILQFFIKTGPFTLLLGAMGALPGFFYSTRPIRLVERGFGELFIGFCYGWLPVASAFYIQTGYIHPLVHWVSLPIGFTIFNVILLNEYPDYPSDKSVGKRNLLVRLGQEKGIIIYTVATLFAWLTFFLSLAAGVPLRALYLFVPLMIVSSFILVMMIRKQYTNHKTLEILCGLNIVFNLGTTASYIYSFL